MPIQKFKYGQEITSAKLNEIVTFVNNLESFSNNAQFWNTNIDSKVAEFQTQLNNILNQVKNLLDTAENFDALLTAFVDLKSKYETLVTGNVTTLLEQVFAPENFYINENDFIVINGVVTNTQLEGIAGPTGATGATGAPGTNGLDGKTILTGSIVPDNNLGTNGDIYFNTNAFDFYLKGNNVWALIGNTRGPQGATGPQGASAQILFRYQTDVGLAYLNQPPASNLIKFLEYKVIYSNETNQQIELKPWVRIQVRNDRFYPKLVSGNQNELLLSWTNNESEWSDNPSGINIKGPRGIDGINGTNGTNGTSVAILGSFTTHLDLPESGATVGDGYIINGDLWVYTAGTTTGTPPAVNSVFRGFVNAGTIEGPAGPAPTIQAEVVATLNPAESASVAVVNTPEGSNNYRLNFSIPRGQTGTRGSLIFSVNTPQDLPTSASWNSITLLLNDLFIVSSTGEISRLISISPWDLSLVYRAAASVHTHVKSDITDFSHTHGNISNTGAIGSTANLPLITTTSGVVTTGSFGTTANTFTQGNDSRLTDARTPLSHVHGNITNTGAIGSTSDQVVVTGSAGVLTTTSRSGIDSRSSFTPSSHTHGNITNSGAIGSTSGLPIITTTSGVLTTGTFGSTAGTFTQGNDSRLSDARTPLTHTHGNITNAGAIGTTADLVVVTGASGVLTTTSKSSIDTRLAFPPESHLHGNITNVGGWNNSPQPIASGNTFVITKSGLLNNSNLSFGTSTNTFLRNDGTWNNPIIIVQNQNGGSTPDITITMLNLTVLSGKYYKVFFSGNAYKTSTNGPTYATLIGFSIDSMTGSSKIFTGTLTSIYDSNTSFGSIRSISNYSLTTDPKSFTFQTTAANTSSSENNAFNGDLLLYAGTNTNFRIQVFSSITSGTIVGARFLSLIAIPLN